jgi:hypothetical protein
VSFAHRIFVPDATPRIRAPTRIRALSARVSQHRELSNERTENASFSVCRLQNHFTTFVCQRILKYKQWLKLVMQPVPTELQKGGVVITFGCVTAIVAAANGCGM